MSLMLKLLAITLLSSTFVYATSNKQVEDFLYKNFKSNPNIKSIKIGVSSKVKIKQMPQWEAFIVDVDATVKGDRKVKQKMIWFSNGIVMSPDLIDIKTNKSLKDSVSPKLEAKHYKKENLIYGNENAKHKVAIFSDPLCPFCRSYVPEAIEYMKKQPENFALYYYHFPLPSLHPAAVELSKAAIAAELQGVKDVVLKLYNVKLDSKERNVSKILKAFNDAVGTKITEKDLKDSSVVKHFEQDRNIADDVMVQGTPTIFFDGVKDKSKKKYLGVK
ncbi:thioredoxin domain-containing protein [Sulfurimonas lithotrophica]|uniref:Thioredoxin domain-containing protein n=1 Tax=Sulfurimonas lithotrophica TaxID=2590022 RepID=A0A5P8P058_9BACT|nr:thioredoxin domain-containing protein [Sulfurimonas lithotrophica]QFR49074.1 thioredoxin domain-containing protein [Sulfurimonas lithotrophica]